MRTHRSLRGERGFNRTRMGAAGWGGGPRRETPLRALAVWCSPKQPSEEGVGGLDSLLGLRHQLHCLTLLPRVIHVARCRHHNLLSRFRRAFRALAFLSQRRGAPERRARPVGTCSAGSSPEGGDVRGVNYISQKAAERGGVGNQSLQTASARDFGARGVTLRRGLSPR